MVVLNTETGEKIEFTADAARVGRLRRRVRAWCEAVAPWLSKVAQGYRLVMVTLTYAGEREWRANHIRDFMLAMRAAVGKDLLAYSWVAELQKRGAVHYHVLLLVKAGADVPMPDKSGLWPHGSSRTETAHTVWYVAKYCQKARHAGKEFPKGLRLFAVWIAPRLVDELARWTFRLSSLPRWLATAVSEKFKGLFPKRRAGGGWQIADETLRSPWRVLAFG